MPQLTLFMNKDVIDEAKRIARKRGVSVSTIFSQFIESIAEESQRQKRPPLGPLTRKAIGMVSLPPDRTDRELIEQILADKYRM